MSSPNSPKVLSVNEFEPISPASSDYVMIDKEPKQKADATVQFPYKNKMFDIPATILENADCVGDVIDYIREVYADCMTREQLDDDDDTL